MAEGALVKYDERQIRGIFRMNWMLKPVTAVKCKVELSTLVIDDLPWYESGKNDLSSSTMNTMELFEIPFRDDYHALIACSYESTATFANKSLFQGIFSDGLIVIEKMFREKAGAHISDVALAMYRHNYEIDNLKQIVFCNVVNDDTVQFFDEDLYTGKNNLDYSGYDGIQNWPHPTPEYLALLATGICSVGVNIVLGAWPRGTHYISSIQTSLGGRNGNSEINILMEIAKIPADLTKMPKLDKETKIALLEAMDIDPSALDSESSKGSESGKGSASGKDSESGKGSESSKGGDSKKRKSGESEESEASEISVKKKKTEESKKRKAEGSEAEAGGEAKKKKTGEPRKSGRIAKKDAEKAEMEAGYGSQMEVDEGEEMDVDEEQVPAKPAKKKAPRRGPVPNRGGR